MSLPAKQAAETKSLPVVRNLSQAYLLSLLTGLLMAGASLGGLAFSESMYPDAELRRAYVANDAVNLLVGLPILLGSLWLTRRGKLVGLLLWPGALLYIIYNYIAYIFGMPLTAVSLVFVALVLLSAYVCYDLLRSIDAKSVKDRLFGAVPVRTAGWVVIAFGVLFIFRATGMLVQSSTPQGVLPANELGTLVADLVLSAVWVVGGIMLLRRMPLGYVSGLGLLFAGSMLFIGLIVYLLLQPVISGVPLAVIDVLVVSVMGLVCSIPFLLYLRGTLSIRK